MRCFRCGTARLTVDGTFHHHSFVFFNLFLVCMYWPPHPSRQLRFNSWCCLLLIFCECVCVCVSLCVVQLLYTPTISNYSLTRQQSTCYTSVHRSIASRERFIQPHLYWLASFYIHHRIYTPKINGILCSNFVPDIWMPKKKNILSPIEHEHSNLWGAQYIDMDFAFIFPQTEYHSKHFSRSCQCAQIGRLCNVTYWLISSKYDQ